MIIDAGMPRTGSTWIFSMIHAMTASLPNMRVHSKYWKYPDHMRWAPDDPRRADFEEQERIAWTTPNDTIFVYKSHEYAPELITKCPRVAIITSHRCLENEAASIWDAGWIPMRNNEAMANFLAQSLRAYESWKTHGPLDVDYATFKAHPDALYGILDSYISYALDISLTASIRLDINKEANPQIPHVDSDTKNFDATQLRQILDRTAHTGIWCLRHSRGFLPRHHMRRPPFRPHQNFSLRRLPFLYRQNFLLLQPMQRSELPAQTRCQFPLRTNPLISCSRPLAPPCSSGAQHW